MRYISAGRTVEIHNGTPTLESLVHWAVARYDQAGMAQPRFDSVTFSRYSEYCEDVQGRAIPTTTETGVVGWDLFLCFDEALACADASCTRFQIGPKRIMLHELAHVWVAGNVGDAVRAQFMEDVGVDTWNDHSEPWEQRGTEWAADTIAWGLMDGPFIATKLGSPPDEQLEAGFRLLTGVQPIRPRR